MIFWQSPQTFSGKSLESIGLGTSIGKEMIFGFGERRLIKSGDGR